MKAKEALHKLQEMARQRGSPMTVIFVTQHCGREPCRGYHPVEVIKVFPDGKIIHHPSPYGLHSLIDPPPKPRPISEREAVALLGHLLTLVRRAKRVPFLSWMQVLDDVKLLAEE